MWMRNEPTPSDLPVAERAQGTTSEQSRLQALRKRAANEAGGLAVTDEAMLRLLAVAGQGGSY